MSESQGGSGGDCSRGTRYSRLVERAMRERWEIPKAVRRPAIERLVKIINDPEAGHREATGAIRILLSASKINLASVSGSIKALEIADLDVRVTELERADEKRKGTGG